MTIIPTFTIFPFNQLPDGFKSDFSQTLLTLFPEPNTAANVFTSTVIQRDNDDQFGLRLDHYLSPKDSLNFRYLFSDGSRFDPLSPSGASVPGSTRR